MQLDRTRLAIRERGLLETIDLALLVVREFAGPIVVCGLLAIVPLALVNYALVGWMVPSEFDEKVECVDPGPNFSGAIKSSRAQIADKGFIPLVSALPKTMMSGTVF